MWRTLLDTIKDPVWLRDEAEQIVWFNRADAAATEMPDSTEAVAKTIELLNRSVRDAAAAARATGAIWQSHVSAVVAGERHTLKVIEVPGHAGSAGIATDLAEIEALRDNLRKQMDLQVRTLDQLSTAVAIFDRSKRLSFYNSAYRVLWSLDPAFLDTKPLDAEILDRLRAERRLPEQADYRGWKVGLMTAYQAVETTEHIWYLPDGRTLRVLASPIPKGGVIYLFDNVTERYHFESLFNALIRVQGETLDTLKEAVAVFGTDGRLKFFNPAFASMWPVEPAKLSNEPHINAIADHCAALTPDDQTWSQAKSTIVGLNNIRRGFQRRVERHDGTVIDFTATPLTGGATLLTFTDVTASVNLERAVKERNHALLEAEIQRNNFQHVVSYELRSPLTNIIGFIQLLSDASVGSLNPKQVEYAGYVTQSAVKLLALINDILDLATINMDAMALNLGSVDIAETMSAAAEGVQDRLSELSIKLKIVAMDGIGAFMADGKRMRQILFNLLSNAISFSAPGQTVTLAALRREDQVIFKVSSQGREIPAEVLDRLFKPFHPVTKAEHYSDFWIRMSLVRSLVILHGGKITAESTLGTGTDVRIIIPSIKLSSEEAHRLKLAT